mmetsp:Transcript_60892/g.181433  ORF Transcript_60892/g.181433 Transcript_60892/m.181433 type:complete len:412 (+) Transcript_60892:91-1326(+)
MNARCRAVATAFGLGCCSLAQATPYSFITLGDWGAVGLGSFHVNAVKEVAEQMGRTAAERQAEFVVNVGDNFYYCGIQNTSDFQLQEDYISVYTAEALRVPWYSALGNHEYGYNVDAQVQFTQDDPTKRWYLPSRFYTKRIEMGAGQHLSLIVLDTSPCVSAYRSSSPSGWDPCSSEFPTCDPIMEGPCRFHENILEQDCGTQFAWFQTQLASVDKSDWLIIMGHHPADEMDVEDFLSVMQAHGFDLYLNGHVHVLEQYSVDGNQAFVTSGAGGMVHTADQDNDPRCQAGFNGTGLGRGTESVFRQKTAGFTAHTFSEDFTTLKTDYISTNGEVLHSFTVTKGKPGPGPSPPPPGPAGKCGGAGAYPCTDGCRYIHKRNEGACSVEKYGCYNCSALPSACPDCQHEVLEFI